MHNILAQGKAKTKVYWMRRAIQNKCLLGEKSSVDPKLIVNHDGEKSLIQIGDNTHVLGQLMTFPGGSIRLGDFCYLSIDSRVWADTEIMIGSRVLISHNVNIFDNQTHPLNSVKRHQQLVHILQEGFPKNLDLGGKPVFIEDDVWIGCNSIVLRGITIGKGAVVGAGSVVTKSVPAWTLVAGNPARVIRSIAEECSEYGTDRKLLAH